MQRIGDPQKCWIFYAAPHKGNTFYSGANHAQKLAGRRGRAVFSVPVYLKKWHAWKGATSNVKVCKAERASVVPYGREAKAADAAARHLS